MKTYYDFKSMLDEAKPDKGLSDKEIEKVLVKANGKLKKNFSFSMVDSLQDGNLGDTKQKAASAQYSFQQAEFDKQFPKDVKGAAKLEGDVVTVSVIAYSSPNGIVVQKVFADEEGQGPRPLTGTKKETVPSNKLSAAARIK